MSHTWRLLSSLLYLHAVPDPSHWYVSPFALRFWFSIPCLHRATYLFSFLHVNRPLSISSLVRLLSIDLKLVVYSSFFVCESERVNYQSVSSSIWVQEPYFRYLDSMSCACHSSFTCHCFGWSGPVRISLGIVGLLRKLNCQVECSLRVSVLLASTSTQSVEGGNPNLYQSRRSAFDFSW